MPSSPQTSSRQLCRVSLQMEAHESSETAVTRQIRLSDSSVLYWPVFLNLLRDLAQLSQMGDDVGAVARARHQLAQLAVSAGAADALEILEAGASQPLEAAQLGVGAAAVADDNAVGTAGPVVVASPRVNAVRVAGSGSGKGQAKSCRRWPTRQACPLRRRRASG